MAALFLDAFFIEAFSAFFFFMGGQSPVASRLHFAMSRASDDGIDRNEPPATQVSQALPQGHPQSRATTP